MTGDWKRGTVSGPQRLQLYAWTAPDLSTTAPALDSDRSCRWPMALRYAGPKVEAPRCWRPRHWQQKGKTQVMSSSGTIARIMMDRGFGFIRDERGQELFFH